MSKKKFLGVVGVLAFCLTLPNNLDALEDRYYIRQSGVTIPLYSSYNWAKDSDSGYLTEAEQKGKKNLSCSDNDIQTWYYRYNTTCGLDSSKISGSKSCSQEFTGIGISKAQSEENCLKAANGQNGSCEMTSGESKLFSINSSNIKYSTVSGEKAGGNYGKWSKNNPNEYLYNKSSSVRKFCTWGSKVELGAKALVQGVYTTTGATPYCINPGKAFEDQEYMKVKTYNVSKCKKSNQSYECGLAAIVKKAEDEYGLDYLTTLTALRLWSASHGQDSDSWWDVQTGKIQDRAGIFRITANYIDSSGYGGWNTIPKTLGVIYANDQGITQLQNAIKIYKEVKSGFDLWHAEVKKIDEKYDVKSEILTVTLESTFNVTTNIKKMEAVGIGEIKNYTSKVCDTNSNKLCYELNISVPKNKSKDAIKIKIDFIHPGDVISKVGLYKAVNNPEKFQYMVLFDRDQVVSSIEVVTKPIGFCTIKDGKWYDRDGKETDYEGYKASCGCFEEDGKYYIDYTDYPDNPVSYEKYYEVCEKVTCPKDGVTTDMPQDCNKDGVSGSMEDPEICNIINNEDADYRTDYGNEYCSVFCRETLDFTFMDKKTAIAGRYFKHDVKAKYSNLEYLSTVILSSRQCTSLIDYDSWEEEYKEANDQVRIAWNDYKRTETQKLHEQSSSKSECNSGCGPSSYSYEEPCGCNWTTITVGGLSWPFCNPKFCTRTENCPKMSPACDTWRWYWSSNTGYNETDASGVEHRRTADRTSGSSSVVTNSCSSCGRSNVFRGDHGTPVSVTKGDYDRAVQKRNELVKKIESCNFVENSATYRNVMSYNPGNKITIEYEEDYDISIANDYTDSHVVSRSYGNGTKWSEYCSSCDSDLSELSSTSNDKHLTYWECSGSEYGARCDDANRSFPSNTVSNIVIEKESLHYQANDFYTQVYTGDVSTRPNNVGYWIPMESHVYPVSIDRKTGDYKLSVTYSNLGNSNRVQKFQSGDFKCTYGVINDLAVFDCDDGYHTCYPCEGEGCDPDNKYDLGVYFRSIDLTDVFPNSVHSPNGNKLSQSVRPIGKNWSTTNASRVIEEIQKLGTEVWQNKPQYKVTLTPNTIKAIQKYNKTTNYMDYSIKCNGLNCTSDFLESELRSIMGNKYGSSYVKDTTVKLDSLYNYKVR